MATIVLTGGGRGLGRATTLSLARLGHRVLFTVRKPAEGEALLAAVKAERPGAQVEAHALDLASQASIRAFAKSLVDAGAAVDVLFNSAGVMQQSPTRRLSADGFEETLAVNALGPYLLTHELWPALARVVNVTSRLHLPGSRGQPVHFDFEDPQLERGYHPERAYKNSKLALLWFTYELARRTTAGGVSVNAVCPGFVPRTAAEVTHGFQKWLMRHVLVHMPFAQSVEGATESFVFMATDPSIAQTSGKFFGEQRVLESSPESHDVEKARRFWDYAAQCTGVGAAWP